MPKLRVEFCSFGSGRGRLGGQVDLPSGEPLGSVTLEVGASPTSPESRPLVPTEKGTVFARLLAVESAVYVDLGAPPDPSGEPRILLLPGRPQLVHAFAGHSLAAMLAGEVSITADSGATGLTDRSGTIAAAGTPQPACPAKAGRRFLLVVPSGVVSIVGAAAGQPFTVAEA
jgi:hypothetical protein